MIPTRLFELCGGDPGPDAVLRLLADAIGQPDDREGRHASLEVRLDLDPPRLQADEAVRNRTREQVVKLDNTAATPPCRLRTDIVTIDPMAA